MVDARTRRREATRREILDAAWERAGEVGVAGISLRDLGAAVGMRAPSLYTYFPSKDAIYDAMFAEGYAALDEHMAAAIAGSAGKDRVEALTAGAAAFVSFCQESPSRYQLMFTRMISGWELAPEAYPISVRSYERSVAALAELGIETQESRDLYYAIVAGLAAQQMANEPEGDRWRRLARPAMEMLVEQLDRQRGAS